MRFGTMDCYRESQHWLTALGAGVEWNKVGRADPCVDRVGVRVATFSDPLARGEYVSKVRSSTRYRGNISVGEFEAKREPRGFKIGSSAAMLRIYDKLYESRNDNEKRGSCSKYAAGAMRAALGGTTSRPCRPEAERDGGPSQGRETLRSTTLLRRAGCCWRRRSGASGYA